MNAFDRDYYEDEISDSELDAILGDVHNELLAHTYNVSDPTRALVAIMNDNEHDEVPAAEKITSASNQRVSERLTVVIEMRYRAAEVHGKLGEVIGRARDLAIDLDKEFTSRGNLTIALTCALQAAQHRDRYLVQLLDHARDLVIQIMHDLLRIRRLDNELVVERGIQIVKELWENELNDSEFEDIHKLDRIYAQSRQITIADQVNDARELAIGLDRARRLSELRKRWQDLDRRNAHELALAIDLVLDRSRDLAAAVRSRLDAFEVDAASADLSNIKIHDARVLQGVIWTDQTVWPMDVAEDVGLLSRELTPGVYQVRPDGRRHSRCFGRHAVRRLPVSTCLETWTRMY